jgi:hypothetical protein
VDPYPYYQAIDTTHGKIEILPTSTLPFSSDQIAVYSGKCKAPAVSIYFNGNYPVQQKAFHQIHLSYVSPPELNHDYIFPDLTLSNPIKLEVLGSSLYLKRGVISFEEAPQNLALGGRIKFTGHFVSNENSLLDIRFDGIIPVPETSESHATKADPDRCEKELNANEKLEKELKVASQCNQSSDCGPSSLFLAESCSGIMINKNATNVDDLERAVEDYNSAFEGPSACEFYYYRGFPSCVSGRCQSTSRSPYSW